MARKQTRRCFSVRRATYDAVKASAAHAGKSASSLVEDALAYYLLKQASEECKATHDAEAAAAFVCDTSIGGE